MAQLIPITKEQLLIIKEMAYEGATITEISNYIGINRAKVRKAIENNSFIHNKKSHVGNKIVWTDDMIARLKVMYASDKIRVEDMVKSLGISERAIVKKAQELGLKKNKVSYITHLTLDEQNYIRNNIDKMSLNQISKKLKRKYDTVRRFVITKGLTYKNNKYPMPTSIEFADDICNPMYSNSALGRMYGYTDLIIKKWRDELFEDFQTMVDTYRCMTVPEIDFRNILTELNLTYLYEHKIDKWKVDFYLGCNLIVEIQGDYWHSLEKVKEKDIRKKNELMQLGYNVIYINEFELKEKDEIKKLIIDNYKKAVTKWMLPS